MTLLHLQSVSKTYRLPRTELLSPGAEIAAVRDVTLEVGTGEAVGIVGASGSGKTTVARLVMGFERPDAGRVIFEGTDIARLPRREMRAVRPRLQIVFQDPMSALDPRKPVGWSVAEPLLGAGRPRAEREAGAARALAAVGLAPGDGARYPHEFSGGQRQRIAIARAIVTEPRLIVADEAVSALDVSVGAQILNLFLEIQGRTGAALLFISHDLAVISRLCARVVVMQGGRIVEEGDAAEVLAHPREPYTRTLTEAAWKARA
ncbi:MAG: ABC transporter ATP-binding protein [Pseudomonadota bacterium]